MVGNIYFSKEHNNHIAIIIAGELTSGDFLCITLSSKKSNPNYRSDPACEFVAGTVLAIDSSYLLKYDSYVRYDLANELKSADITKLISKGLLSLKGQLKKENLLKIQAGAKRSDELIADYLTKYFP